MSENFYKYISDKLLKFFMEESIQYGDKYFVEFDEVEQVRLLYENLKKEASKNNLSYGTFQYQYEDGKPYETYYISIKDDCKLIVANSDSVTMGFLTTLRNAVPKQEGKWKNTILLIIGHDINDSIENGMRNLQKEGNPLHFKTISNNLLDEIYDKNNKISKVDREIIKYSINSKETNTYENDIWDYEEVLGLINKGFVEDSDLEKMKLFPDPGLEENLRPTSIQKRLQDNNETFVSVEDYHRYEDTKDRLSRKYDSAATTKLANKNWKETEYTYIRKHLNNNQFSLEYLENEGEKRTLDDELIYWERPLKTSKAGLRKRHIIVFNDKKLEQVKLAFDFDTKLKNKFLKSKSDKITVKAKQLLVNIDVSLTDTTFERVVYEHENTSKLRYEFNIAVVNCSEELLHSIKSNYLISTTSRQKSIEIVNEDTSTPVIIGNGSNEITEEIEENGQLVYIKNDDSIKISENSAAWSVSEKLYFKLIYNSFKIPISIKEEQERVIPTKSVNIWNLKRQNESNFSYRGNKVIQGVNSFYIEESFKKILSIEKQMILEDILYGKINVDGTITPKELDISNALKTKLNYILQYYKNIEIEEDNCGYPSLVYLDSSLEALYEDFLDEYNSEIESIEENKALNSEKSKYDLNKIGVFYKNNEIYLSSLSPINMAYQLEVKKQLKNEKLESNVINRINNENLIPYIYNTNDELFKPRVQNVAKEWIKYEKNEDVSIGSTNQFISKVIEQKIKEFIYNFNYLFIEESKAPIKLNIINIKDDKEIVKGVCTFLNERIKSNKSIIPVELNLYNDGHKSYFDELFACQDEDDFNKKFDIKLKSKDMDLTDVLHLIQNNITYYRNTNDFENDYDYAHISFYKLSDRTGKANHPMNEIETGLSLDGILSEPTSFNSDSGHRIGFGSKDILNPDTTLIRTIINSNELIQNTRNGGNDSYIKGQTIVAKPTEPNEKEINKLYDNSLWVTFIEPSFGLEYFNDKNNLVVIHYSDQYTSSNKYDTITVTNKNSQYKDILNNFLETKYINANDDQLNHVIKIFNGINGEWLLRVIKDNTFTDREKLSIISAIKYVYALLNHSDILWVPISMEEILRIAGTVGLSKKDGLFKKSSLIGKFSDDVLFVGINIKQEDIKVYYYPVEVKQGHITNSTMITAEDQLSNTIDLIKKELLTHENHEFKNKFYRNFFMQLALANINKLKNLDFWSDRKLEKISEIKKYLINDDYSVSNELESYIGRGSVVAFKHDPNLPESKIDYKDDIQIIQMPDEFAYNGLIKTIPEICDQIINKSEFKEDDLLSNKMSNGENIFAPSDSDNKNGHLMDVSSPRDTAQVSDNSSHNNTKTSISVKPKTGDDEANHDEKVDNSKDGEEITIDNKQNENKLTNLNDVRALIGTIKNGDEKVYWEYGNPELSNRHLLILGKSGYGKTYFMQCLISEMSKQDIPTLIIDYSDAFMTKEIQDELKDYLGNNLVKYTVKREQFPLNPFRKNKIEYDEDDIDYETNLDVSSRIKSVFSSVYNLGIVQQNTLVKAINSGLEKYGEQMSFDGLMEQLDDPDNKNAQSILNQLNEFLMFNPFKIENEFDWSELDERSKKVIIIQLHGYSKDIQKIITEFILWDLWNYKSLHGDSDQPFNVLLDEAQNLDFSEDSPCVKILKEGRKKGWSVWFATQSIKGILKNAEVNPFNNANQMIYFHPADNVRNIAAEFTSNNQDKGYWSEKLSELNKGECISIGPSKNFYGELNSPKPQYLKINSLKERI